MNITVTRAGLAATLLFLSGAPWATDRIEQSTPDDICAIVSSPDSYDGKRVEVRGSVYLGRDAMNISDPNCPGKPITMKIGGDVFRRSDVQKFYKEIYGYGHHGVATIEGIFSWKKGALAEYEISVKKIHGVRSDR